MRLLGIIFGRKHKTKTEDKKLPFFRKDGYCQIEIVPRKNQGHIEKSHGFTDVFERDELPFPTLAEEIRIDHFEKSFTDLGFEKASQIRQDEYTRIDCSVNTLNAISLSSFNLFYDYKGEFVNNIWGLISLIISPDEFDKISAALYKLGEQYELLLVDWNNHDL